MSKKTILVLTGAGISAESGIKTFRDADGLWEGQDVMAVASPEGWRKNRELVLRFYNERRAQLHTVQPNAAHYAIAELEKKYTVWVVTQNVDDLHERGGSRNIVHLHGELLKARSSNDPKLVYDWPGDIKVGDKCEKGAQLRPHIVWFGEDVPLIGQAVGLAKMADMVLIVGTSMVVYPAAGLVEYCDPDIPKYYIDPKPAAVRVRNLTTIAKRATEGVPELVKQLLEEAE